MGRKHTIDREEVIVFRLHNIRARWRDKVKIQMSKRDVAVIVEEKGVQESIREEKEVRLRDEWVFRDAIAPKIVQLPRKQ